MALLPPTTKVIFFIRICDSVHRGVGVPACLASHMTPPTEQNPPPPEAGTPSRADIPRGQTLLREETPPHPGAESSPPQPPRYGKKRKVRILLECILVRSFVSLTSNISNK